MFSSKNTTSSAQTPTLLGEGAVIKGEISVKGRVQVDGRIEGILKVDGQVSIGPKGSVDGELIADDVAVGGTVEGKVTARQHLHVVATGKITGDVRYDTLQVDKGAVLDGRTVHDEASPAKAVAEASKSGKRPRPSTAPAAATG